MMKESEKLCKCVSLMAIIKKSFKLKISTQTFSAPKHLTPSPNDKDVPQLVFVGVLRTGLCFPRRYISDTPAADE